MISTDNRLEAGQHPAVETPVFGFRLLHFAILLGLAFLLLAAAYFSPHIWRHDEAREALVIQDIVRNHDWILPLRNHELPSKPILYHWIAAALATFFGLSDFTTRLPSVIAAFVMAAVTCRLGSLTRDRKVAVLAVAILASTYEFWDSGTEARVDMLFAALCGGALAGWYVWYCTGSNLARITVYWAVAGAVLAKGPAGVVLPVLVIGAFVLLERNGGALKSFISWRWVTFAAALDLGWYMTAYHFGGEAFFHKQIVFENVERFLGTGDFHTRKSMLSQGYWFITQLFPWSLVILWALLRRLRGQSLDRFSRFLHTWWLGILVFFLLARGQRAVYLLPIYPAVALLAARECAAFWHRCPTLGWFSFGRNWRATAALLLVGMDLSLGAAVPISRTIREDTAVQEAFVEKVAATLPAGASLRASMDFPDTALMVLAYRLDRSIRREPMDCRSQGYYLASAELSHCRIEAATIVVSSSDHSLKLLHWPRLTGRWPAARMARNDHEDRRSRDPALMPWDSNLAKPSSYGIGRHSDFQLAKEILD